MEPEHPHRSGDAQLVGERDQLAMVVGRRSPVADQGQLGGLADLVKRGERQDQVVLGLVGHATADEEQAQGARLARGPLARGS